MKTGARAREHIFRCCLHATEMTDGEQSTESFFPRWRLRFSLLENGSKSRRLPTKRILLAGSWVPGRLIFVLIDLIPWAYTQIHNPTVVQGGGGGGGVMEPGRIGGTPPRSFWCCSISKRLCLQWKAFDLLNKMRYILWVLLLLGGCDVTNNGRQLGRHLRFYK